uniref:Uncharacterized protein n=1 Tax=viral metagenome TaxID=1070528 RepID=A0A6H1ZR53_9ZZZZ
MSVRRKTASPIFQIPLTKREIIISEVDRKVITREEGRGKLELLDSPLPKFIVCHKCKTSGGTLIKVKEGRNKGKYECQDTGKCQIMSSRKKVKK